MTHGGFFDFFFRGLLRPVPSAAAAVDFLDVRFVAGADTVVGDSSIDGL